ncbi:hypothetical protein SPHINGO391_500119 [Sphingomonas aurantiaca]|uniref:Uncharacterized protein n=1 Tax=Sphingomonas aurantiaca TaxID=185949 RepID=A0A5E8AAF4_9SPHN|nr:hypothetical protein SPHINGO391_500119 [Sphingomonas aurantiaca]
MRNLKGSDYPDLTYRLTWCDFRLLEIADALRASAGSKSNKARTQAANVRELGLAACGELAGVVHEPLVCLKQRHPASIAIRRPNVKSAWQPIVYSTGRIAW